MARSSTNKAPTTEDLGAQMEALKSDLSNLTRTIADMGKAQGQQFADTAKAQADAAREAGEAQLARARDQAVHMTNQADEFVTKNPAAAMGIAAGVGFLVGMMATRK
ncbi:DUF883 family protein [Aliiroseovarius sp. YM-037]|uniref:DUF883 family protein n=1 Tax=Aliiroseovarius sp. YM-037 TaxID=3341728 RepID=UPI003A7FDC8F